MGAGAVNYKFGRWARQHGALCDCATCEKLVGVGRGKRCRTTERRSWSLEAYRESVEMAHRWWVQHEVDFIEHALTHWPTRDAPEGRSA